MPTSFSTLGAVASATREKTTFKEEALALRAKVERAENRADEAEEQLEKVRTALEVLGLTSYDAFEKRQLEQELNIVRAKLASTSPSSALRPETNGLCYRTTAEALRGRCVDYQREVEGLRDTVMALSRENGELRVKVANATEAAKRGSEMWAVYAPEPLYTPPWSNGAERPLSSPAPW